MDNEDKHEAEVVVDMEGKLEGPGCNRNMAPDAVVVADVAVDDGVDVVLHVVEEDNGP